MLFNPRTAFSSLLAFSLLAITPTAFANHDDSWNVDRLFRQPVVKQAAIGAAAGAAGGMLSDRVSTGKGVITGAVVGGGTGLLSQSRFFQGKPLARRALQGAVVGTGVSYASDNDKLKGALIGAGAGAGYHYIRQYIDNH
jgi:hypothetical protein